MIINIGLLCEIEVKAFDVATSDFTPHLEIRPGIAKDHIMSLEDLRQAIPGCMADKLAERQAREHREPKPQPIRLNQAEWEAMKVMVDHLFSRHLRLKE